MNQERLRRLIGGGAASFGIGAIVAPAAMNAAYGVANTPDTRLLLRGWGTRTTVLGVLALGATQEEWARLAPLTTAMTVVDALIDLVAVRDGASRRNAILGALSSGSFAGALAYSTRLGR
jgi:hypothetical protein